MKLCVLFPGIGYHCDKPLLYYTAKLARSKGYEVIALRYLGFPEGTKGNDEKMRRAALHALGQSEEQLAGTDMTRYERIVFAGKSIGTAACLAFRERYGVKAECLLYTPLEMTFEHPAQDCTAFHGTSDPWADTAAIERLCGENGVKLYKYSDANHSIETGDALRDIAYLGEIIGISDILL